MAAAAAALRCLAALLELLRAALAATALAAASAALVKSQVRAAAASPPAASHPSAMSTQYMGPEWPGVPRVRLAGRPEPPLLLPALLPLLPSPAFMLLGPLVGNAASTLCMTTVPSAQHTQVHPLWPSVAHG